MRVYGFETATLQLRPSSMSLRPSEIFATMSENKFLVKAVRTATAIRTMQESEMRTQSRICNKRLRSANFAELILTLEKQELARKPLQCLLVVKLIAKATHGTTARIMPQLPHWQSTQRRSRVQPRNTTDAASTCRSSKSVYVCVYCNM
jgi:hypothetical protein